MVRPFGSQPSGPPDHPLQQLSGAIGTGETDWRKDLLSYQTPWIDLDGLRQPTPVGQSARWSQPVEATELRLSPELSSRRSSANTSAGVLNPSIARGRSLISSATRFRYRMSPVMS